MAGGKGAHEVHLNLNVRGLPTSSTLALNERCSRLIREGRPVWRLGLGQSPFPVPEPVVEELRDNAHQKAYLPVKGLEALRESIAGYFNRTQNLSIRAEDIIVGPGSKELMFILQLVYYGDLVIPTPSWVSYAPQAHIIGRHVRWLPTRRENSWLLTPQELDSLCRQDPTKPRIVVLNYPNNPTGCSYAPAQLEELAQVARRYHAIVLSDEIYGDLHFAGEHQSIARYYPEGTIVSNGLSKWCGAGGWRLGAFAFPESLGWLLSAMAVVASETYTSTCAPVQYAAVRAFSGGAAIERYLENCRAILEALGREVRRRLRAAGVEVVQPQGGFYLFPDFSPFRESLATRGIVNSTDLCEHLLEHTGVAILPGSVFGHSEQALTARLAYVDFDGSRALAAMGEQGGDAKADSDFIERLCGNVLEAIDRLVEWLR